jgi:hypothetical protein
LWCCQFMMIGLINVRREYKMRRSLFCKIMNVVCVHDSYFVQHKDAYNRLGHSTIQKCIITLKMHTTL